ncbi:NUDIX hydrolase [Conexivisphaera calida]|uniref:MutT/nudix family protein n=1 Tax=Conexivisphaera calida TaxID=1874277 RepID=A0A4P2VBB7_9ARCH|nr:CoA pyrophosphatase [Conexivisphaera calida]BBE41809.1 MutT/nudix family protein [Conexivisphaera calida]
MSVLLDGGSGRYRVLVVKRVESSIDPWSGDWALPGGRMEATDPDLRATAVRETLEETGIDLRSSAEFMFELDFFSPTNAPWMHVKPFAYRLLRHVDVRLSRELSDYVWVYLDDLRESIDQSGRPEFRLAGGGRIWGMTARILLAVKERLGYR